MTLTIFRELFGNSPLVRTIDFFLDNSVFDYGMADVVREEGMSYNTLRPVWRAMIARGIIVETRVVGKAKKYKLNRTNPLVKRLWDLNVALVESDLQNSKEKKEKRRKGRKPLVV